MEKKISEKVENLLQKKAPDEAQINNFIKANEGYEKLIQDGLAIKRGFNLLTTQEIYNPALNGSSYQSSQRYNS